MDNILVKFENLKDKNPLKAIHLIKQAINDDAINYDYLVALGKYLCQNGKDKEGMKYLKRAEKIAKLQPNIAFILALAYMRTEEYHLAIKLFEDVYDLYPEANYNASICYVRVNELDKAINQARNLVNNKILGKESSKLIIDIYSFLGDGEKIDLEVENYKKKFGEDDMYYCYKGNSAIKKSSFLESASYYAKISKNYPERHLFIEKYAYSLVKLNQFNKAIEVYQEVVETTFVQEDVILEYAEVLYHLGRYQDALDVMNNHRSIIINKDKFKDIRAKAYYKLHLE